MRSHVPVNRTASRVGAGASLARCMYYGVAWPLLADWGATPEEVEERLPGDEVIDDPASCTTRATSIRADPSAVWPWLVQIGTDRAGWYSYDRLERLVGVPVRSADRVHEEWQHLRVGDRVCLAPPGWMGVAAGVSLPVVQIDPGRCVVLRQSPPESPWDGIWSFHVRAEREGRSRVVIRSRTAGPHGFARAVAPLGGLIPAVMEIGMLHGLRSRVERADRGSGGGSPASTPAVGEPW